MAEISEVDFLAFYLLEYSLLVLDALLHYTRHLAYNEDGRIGLDRGFCEMREGIH